MIVSDRDLKRRHDDTMPTRLKSVGKHPDWARSHFMIEPFFSEKQVSHGMSYGLSCAGYDIRLGKIGVGGGDGTLYSLSPGAFVLASSYEELRIPEDWVAVVHDKSTWARCGLALQNTVLEPGWCGYITLELSNHGMYPIALERGMPIAQLLFHQMTSYSDNPYSGKYQNQPNSPVLPKYEGDPDGPA